jgi:hypothetical protein
MIKQTKLDKDIIGSKEKLVVQKDIYSGQENIQFNNRHPIFKTLMKLEFEDILRSFPNNPFQE